MGYAQYKELGRSGVSWLQKKPSHWRIKRLKFSTDLINNKVRVEDSPLPYLGLEHIESWTGRKINGEISNSEGLASSFVVGDVLFGKLRPYLAKVYLAQQDGLISSEALVVRSKDELHAEFLKYYMLSRDFINIVDSSTYGSKMPRASWDFIGNLPVLLPDVEEQKVIARFLDFKTAQIDSLIAKKKALLDKLVEKRTALISHAVTKGLDSSVAMKDSGVAWLGKIPVHWAIDRAKWSVSSCQNGVWGAEPDGEDDLVCIRVADFDRQSLRVSTEKLTMRSIAEKDRRNRLLNNGDLLLEKSGGGEHQLVGTVVEFNQPFPAVSSNFIARMVASDDFDPRFLVYVHSHLYAGRVNYRSIKQTTGIQNLDSQSYLDESIAYPPLEEQKVIGKFLDDVSARMDVQKELINAVIDRLMEYRSALVTNAVTGKIDVRGFEISQSAEGIAS